MIGVGVMVSMLGGSSSRGCDELLMAFLIVLSFCFDFRLSYTASTDLSRAWCAALASLCF